jgi:hypothetical protein
MLPNCFLVSFGFLLLFHLALTTLNLNLELLDLPFSAIYLLSLAPLVSLKNLEKGKIYVYHPDKKYFSLCV